MLKRKIYQSLIEWKKQTEKMCLVVKGARQVGKTFIIDKFEYIMQDGDIVLFKFNV